ncbi:glycosyltransferase family 2 protein (plasmid) [Aquicoccus sp. G2-2]|uniref:glycosyltransferase family 2 protein n=1 Tax=Aquicoccus sp. G2-2 TaxID=3092120 RepID=UPI002ADF1F3B|nr:glycosyltransferase family 2 protein [Aquicoccus sp. G2-2]MEA1111938.1 glycosyltransferase family 2 protein [Aquicoccus sp. G2-2]
MIEAFLAHHLTTEVTELFVFFDDPCDGLAEVFADVPRVTTIACDSDYWAKYGPKKGRPKGHRQRQTHNAELAARRLCKTEWIAHIDADEFLYPRASSSISSILSNVPNDIDAVRILPAEHMFSEKYNPGQLSLQGYFKLKPPNGSRWGHVLYGDLGEFFPNGFQGHEVGKSFKRTSNREARFNIHFVRKDRTSIPEVKISQEQAVLLHYFPASFEDWCHKFERRVEDAQYFQSMPEHAQRRYGLYESARRQKQPDGVDELFRSLNVLPKNSPALKEKPELFIRPDLNFVESTQTFVRPYVRAHKFEHVSSPSKDTISAQQRIFQIGMNRCGTREICAMFGRRGFSYAHWDGGNLAKSLRIAKAGEAMPFSDYAHYQLLSDISYGSSGADIYDGFYDFEYIHSYFPDGIFVLNYRPVEEWLASRKKFRKGQYLIEHQQAYGLPDEGAVLEKWKSDWEQHAAKVRAKAAKGELRLVEYSLNTEKPSAFFQRLQRLLDDGYARDEN